MKYKIIVKYGDRLIDEYVEYGGWPLDIVFDYCLTHAQQEISVEVQEVKDET